MLKRIRRNPRTERRVDHTAEIEDLMKSIATSQSMIEQHNAKIAKWLPELQALMAEQGVENFQVNDIFAEITRSAGRASNVIDPVGFRKLVKDDKEFFSAISVSVTAAKKVLPEKALAKITTTTPGKIGDPVIRVYRGPKRG